MQCVLMDEGASPLIAVVGPTAVGKTEVAIRLAQDFNGVIVSADSRQVYRKMDIGTAKPNAEDLAKVPHELIDIIDPDEDLGLAQFQKMAYEAINRSTSMGKLPILVGGTGQYVKAVVEGWGIPEVPPQLHLRSDLMSFADTYGSTLLHSRLEEVDPVSAAAIDFRNIRRVVRALEVYVVAGMPMSALQQRHLPPFRIHLIGLTRPRDSLYERVDARIDAMIRSGFVDEVEELLEQGFNWGLPSMSSLGYPAVGAYLAGKITLEEAIATIKRDTRRFIRHQYNWFDPDDPQIRWFDLSVDSYDLIRGAVSSWLG
jgi:tRNA dimethylallyltransferase